MTKSPIVLFDPGAVARPNPLKWVVSDYLGDTVARFAHRDDADMFAQITKHRPYRTLARELRP